MNANNEHTTDSKQSTARKPHTMPKKHKQRAHNRQQTSNSKKTPHTKQNECKQRAKNRQQTSDSKQAHKGSANRKTLHRTTNKGEVAERRKNILHSNSSPPVTTHEASPTHPKERHLRRISAATSSRRACVEHGRRRVDDKDDEVA